MIDSSIILPSKPKIISEDGTRGVYETDGLYPGYGHTLGNSLRRIILSSLPGTAITSLKVAGAEHEFSTLPGVKEDVIMIILNLKKINFKLVGNEPQIVKLSVSGAKEVTAGDIEKNSQAEVLNKDLHLATLTDKKASLEIEMTVEKGLGYLSKDAIRRDRNEIGTIFLDAAFTPIRRVSYEVEKMRVGDRTDYNRLRLNIETDGTITPHEALESSIEIMINQLRAMIGFRGADEMSASEELSAASADKKLARAEAKKERENEREKESGDALKTRVEELDLSPRVSKALTEGGIRTAGGLARKKVEDLLAISGLGEKGVQEIKKALGKLGLSLK